MPKTPASSPMMEIIRGMPEQIHEGMASGARVDLKPLYPKRVLTCGMGGSAIAGDLVASCDHSGGPPEYHTIRNYALPGWASKEDLVVAISYSGNTEETLSCFQQAQARGCHLIALGSGGQLEVLADRGGVPMVKIPGGLPPRGAIGYLFSALAILLDRLGAGAFQRDLTQLTGYVSDLIERFSSTPREPSPPGLLAQRLVGTTPVIYATAAYAAVARRWQTQLNENSKVLAWHSEVPEMDHNEIVGWVEDSGSHGFTAIFLEDPKESPAMARRLQATKELMGARVRIETLRAEGRTTMERLFHLLLLGDLTSVHLADLRGVDPLAVRAIDELKKKLAA